MTDKSPMKGSLTDVMTGLAPVALSSDLTFVTNEPGKTLRDRFGVLLRDDTRCFDCLVGYFFISGFYRLYPALEKVEKVRILVGLQTDRTAYELLQRAKVQGELTLQSHATAKEQVSNDLLSELETSPDSAEIETGVHKFVEWIRSGKLEIKAYPSVAPVIKEEPNEIVVITVYTFYF
ncbi:MAG: hypothetical protein Q8Q12_16480 [bacterium]|nr:hypothetical protein [bacterium]